MKKKRYKPTIRVAKPCTEDWGRMSGNEQVRFCSHCAKSVNNISTMTERDARRLVRESNGNLCIRYMQHPKTGAPVFANQLLQITRGPRMALSVMATSMSLSAFAYAQGGVRPARTANPIVDQQLLPLVNPDAAKELARIPEAKPDETRVIKNGDTPTQYATIWGQVTDEAGAAVAGATVALLDASKKQVISVVTGEDGFYRLEQIEYGEYQLTIEARNFTRQLIGINLGAVELNENVQLSPRRVATMGVIAVSTTRVINYRNLLTPAVESDDIKEVRDLLARGENPNVAEEDGSTPLFKAVENNNLKMVRLLLDAGARATHIKSDKHTLLMVLDEDSKVEMVDLILREGVDVNAFNEDGDTALILAAESVKPDVISALINAGANINAQNNEGVSALMNAANDDNLENVRTLILAGADVNLRDEEGDNAWDYAADDEVEQLLVSHGCVVDPDDLADEPEQSDEPADADEPEDTDDEP